MTHTNWEKMSKETGEKMTYFIDHTRVKSSLLKLEMRDEWNFLKEFIQKTSRYLHHAHYEDKKLRETAEVKWHLGMMEARERWEAVKDLFQQLEADSGEVKKEWDYAKLFAHLAKMDAEDAIEERMQRWSKTYNRNLKPKAHEALKFLKSEVDETVSKFH